MAPVGLKSVSGDLYVGEARLFFKHPRYAHRAPYRLQTSSPPGIVTSLCVRSLNPDLVVLCDSGLNPDRVVRKLNTTDIAVDTEVRPYEKCNGGRWTCLTETSDGQHWSAGELQCKVSEIVPPDKVLAREEATLSRLTATLPGPASQAVLSGRSVMVSRTGSFLNKNNSNTKVTEFFLSSPYRAFNTRVYPLCCTNTDGKHGAAKSSVEIIALLFVGRFWPDDTEVGKKITSMQPPPPMTVVRERVKGDIGSRVFCICLGNFLSNTLEGKSVEDVAGTRRHYEGYFSDKDVESFKWDSVL